MSDSDSSRQAIVSRNSWRAKSMSASSFSTRLSYITGHIMASSKFSSVSVFSIM